MNKKIARFLIATATALWISHIPCNADGAPVVPAELDQIVQEAMMIKAEAMRHQGMRHDKIIIGEDMKIGVSGKEFRSIMDQIADYPMTEELVEKTRKFQNDNINFKIIYWALDRRNRAKEYKRFSRWYLNYPETHRGLIEHYLRGHPGNNFTEEQKKQIPNIRVIYPNGVAPKDRSEDNRPIIEFLYFSPPDGRKFHVDSVRGNLAQALLSLKKYERSFIVWKSDLEIALDIPLGNEKPSSGIVVNTQLAVYPFVEMATTEAFSVIGSHWPRENAQEATIQLFQSRWSDRQMPFDDATYNAAKKHYDTWMSLANRDWKAPGEKEFAEWLKQQVPPVAPPPLEYAVDPDDPFLPQPPSGK